MIVVAIVVASKARLQNVDVFAFHTEFSVESSLWRLQRDLFEQHGIRAHAFVEGSNCTHDHTTTCVPGVSETPSRRHAFVLDTALRAIKRRRKPVLFIDGDVLPLPNAKLDLAYFLRYCVVQTRPRRFFGPDTRYCWPGMLGFVPNTMQDKSFAPCCGGDTGAQTSHLAPPFSRRATTTECNCSISTLLPGLPCPVLDKAFIHIMSHTSTWRFPAETVRRNTEFIRRHIHECS